VLALTGGATDGKVAEAAVRRARWDRRACERRQP